jgi:5-methylcytosine-specific restriction endonuclease McrA
VPIDILSVYDAVAKVFAGRAKFLDTDTCTTYDFEGWVDNWDEAIRTATIAADKKVIGAPHFKFLLPEIVICTEYRGFGYKISHRTPKFSRENIYRRDRNTCFAAGTMVLMADGRQVPIENISVGEKVIDANGKPRKVMATVNRWSEDVVAIRYRGSQIRTVVTKEHPFLSSTGEYKPISDWSVVEGRQRGEGDYLVCPRAVEYEVADDGAIDVSKFFAGKWFRFRDGRLFWSKRRHEPGFPAVLEASKDLAYLMGLYCAEGSVSNRNVTFSLHEKERGTLASDIQRILTSMGLNSVVDGPREDGHGIAVRTSSKMLAGIVLQACGSGAYNKHTPWQLVGKHKKDFLRGLLLGDGYITEEFNKVAFNVASFQLVMDVQSIALGMGMHVTLQAGERPDGRRYWSAIFQGDNYVRLMREVLGRSLDYTEADYPKRQFGNDGFVFRKLTDVCEAEPCVVYNIEVEESHSYIANGLAVHNCQFCGKKFKTDELTMDHVIPKSKGGQMTWENIVLACNDCNNKKADRTPEQAGMKLIRKPCRPTVDALKRTPIEKLMHKVGGRLPKTWEQFLGKISPEDFLNTMYWKVELKD